MHGFMFRDVEVHGIYQPFTIANIIHKRPCILKDTFNLWVGGCLISMKFLSTMGLELYPGALSL